LIALLPSPSPLIRVRRLGSTLLYQQPIWLHQLPYPLREVPPTAWGNRASFRFPPLREGNLKEGGEAVWNRDNFIFAGLNIISEQSTALAQVSISAGTTISIGTCAGIWQESTPPA